MNAEDQQKKQERVKELILNGTKTNDILETLKMEFDSAISKRDLVRIRREMKEKGMVDGLSVEIRQAIGILITFFYELGKKAPAVVGSVLKTNPAVIKAVQRLQEVRL